MADMQVREVAIPRSQMVTGGPVTTLESYLRKSFVGSFRFPVTGDDQDKCWAFYWPRLAGPHPEGKLTRDAVGLLRPQHSSRKANV